MQGQGQERAPSRIVTEDYSLGFNVPDGLMPDSQFNGLDAEIQVHRIKPEWDPGQRPSSVPAVVLIHGRTVPGPVLFDLHTPPRAVAISACRERLRRQASTPSPRACSATASRRGSPMASMIPATRASGRFRPAPPPVHQNSPRGATAP